MTHERYRARLLARLQELEGRLAGIEHALDAPHSTDWDEAAVEREGDEVLEGLGVSGHAEMTRIKAALRRMDEGEYGFCVNCGEPIAEARLDILPEAALCTRCAAGGR